MLNAFNECDHTTFLCHLNNVLPELEAWVRWCYSCSGELRFGPHRLKASAGVQQGDPLGPLLLSLMVLELMDRVGEVEGIHFFVWYLDDGIFIGEQSAISSLLCKLQSVGPDLGIHLNLPKCEVFWPSGSQNLEEISASVRRVIQTDGGVDLLGTPIYGSTDYCEKVVKRRVEKVLAMQDHLQI